MFKYRENQSFIMKKKTTKKTTRKTSQKKVSGLCNFKGVAKEQACGHGTGGCFYFLGFLGSLIYYLSTAPTFWDAVIGFFKAIVWPAFVVHGLLQLIAA